MARQTSTVSGVWKKDSVKVRPHLLAILITWRGRPDPYCDNSRLIRCIQDVAESVGIANLPDDVAGALAGDVEYRLWEIIEVRISPARQLRLGR